MSKNMTDEEFDRRFEAGEDISAFVNWKAARRPGLEAQRVNVVAGREPGNKSVKQNSQGEGHD